MSSELKIKFNELSEAEKQEFINWINNPQNNNESNNELEIPEENIIYDQREFLTDERDKWEMFKNNLNNYFWSFYDVQIKKTADELQVGDVFYHSTFQYGMYAKPCIITRMTQKTIFYKYLKDRRYAGWYNQFDHGLSERIKAYNINNLEDMKEKRMKKGEYEYVIDITKIDLNNTFYYGENGL